jgi:hypothetical protein
MENYTAYLAARGLKLNDTTAAVMPIPVAAAAADGGAVVGSDAAVEAVYAPRTPQMFTSTATSCVDAILLRSPDAQEKSDSVIYTQRFTGDRLTNSSDTVAVRLAVLELYGDTISTAVRIALQAGGAFENKHSTEVESPPPPPPASVWTFTLTVNGKLCLYFGWSACCERPCGAASLDADPNFSTGSFTTFPVNQLSSDFPFMCRNPYVSYSWQGGSH